MKKLFKYYLVMGYGDNYKNLKIDVILTFKKDFSAYRDFYPLDWGI